MANLSFCTSNPEILGVRPPPATTVAAALPAGRVPSIRDPRLSHSGGGGADGAGCRHHRNLSAQLDSAFPNCNLDVDGNGLIDATTDGVAMLRAATWASAARTLARPRASVRRTRPPPRCINRRRGGNRRASQQTSAGDGLVILRAMLGLTGSAVTTGVVPGSGSHAVEHARRRQQQHSRMAQRDLRHRVCSMTVAAGAEAV